MTNLRPNYRTLIGVLFFFLSCKHSVSVDPVVPGESPKSQFDFPSTLSSTWTYTHRDVKLYKEATVYPYYDSTIVNGVRIWQIVGQNTVGDTLMLNISYTGVDTVHFRSLTRTKPYLDSIWVDSTYITQPSGSFLANVSSKLIRLQFPEIQVLLNYDSNFDSLRCVNRLSAKDSTFRGYGGIPGWSASTTFKNKIGLLELNAQYYSGMSYRQTQLIDLKLVDSSLK